MQALTTACIWHRCISVERLATGAESILNTDFPKWRFCDQGSKIHKRMIQFANTNLEKSEQTFPIINVRLSKISE